MNKVIVLAAGKGTRMNDELPKVLVPVNNKPMIQYLIEAILASGVCDKPIVVVSPDNQDLVKKALNSFDCDYAIQKEQLGTGHAFASARDLIGSEVENLISFYGDHPFLKPESMRKLVKEHKGALTMMTVNVPNFDKWHNNFYRWGRIVRDMNGKIEKIVEFKDASDDTKRICEVNPGLFCFDKKWLIDNIDKLRNENNQQEYYLTDMVKMAFAEGHEIASSSIDPKEAMGINSKEELAIAESLFDK
ncbi:NTP transferase domain-containing protein [Candidatus Falkowbacteria bacterium]|nr:NTP transferase domain-containing protein [Candidatus Falkowbacteria bacterium]